MPFTDLTGIGSDLAEALQTAYAYGLLHGYGDGTSRPHALVTREQAIVFLFRAMIIAGLKPSGSKSTNLLEAYVDRQKVSPWAVDGIAEVLQAGIAQGRPGMLLAPQDTLTRAEAAVLVRNLLRAADLI